MATTNNNIEIVSVSDFCTDLENKISSMRNDFASNSAFSDSTIEQQESFFMAIALNQFNCGVEMSDGSIIMMTK